MIKHIGNITLFKDGEPISKKYFATTKLRQLYFAQWYDHIEKFPGEYYIEIRHKDLYEYERTGKIM